MKSVNVSKTELLNVLRENKAKHIEEYTSAMTVYRTDVIEKLEQLLAAAKIEAEKETPKFDTRVDLAEPATFVESYDTAIRMLEMSTDSIIELSQQEFSQYVEDKWSWGTMFKATTSFYNSKLA